MPEHVVTFEVIEGGRGTYTCCICGTNPATLKLGGTQAGECCLQCAFTMLADLAERTVDKSIQRAG